MSVSPNTELPDHVRSRLIAAALAGSWLNSPPSFQLSADELAAITPTVIKGAAGALLWWRIRHTELAQSESGAQLKNLYRLHRLEARVHAYKIKTILAHLNQAGIEPVLMKGWGIARLYPEPGLRHYCDLDLCVEPGQFRAARKALRSLGPLELYVDLHRGLGRHEKLSWSDLFARSQEVQLDGWSLRILGAEDHLRLLCIHWLSHGGWSPLGLCDIACALEARPAGFNWEICLGPDKKRADWIACTLGVAHQLLGAVVDGTPVADRARHLPRWLIPAVLEQWETCFNPHYRDMALAELPGFLATPGRLLAEVAARWRHPIRATIEARGRFNDLPRWPYQLAALLLRSPELPRQIALMLWRQAQSLRKREAVTRFQISDL
jgi:hypothetical protein